MSAISQVMTDDHRRCDAYFSDAENAVESGDWAEAKKQSDAFIAAMEAHLGAEEQTLFPAFEEQTGMTQGPTQVMRMEHQQMRNLFAQMNDALERQDADDFLGSSETLLVLMQQHNMKEEGILYPMCDNQLGDQHASVSEQVQQQLTPSA